MKESNMPACQKCGAMDWEALPGIGALEIMRCRRCGAEETVHTYYVNKVQEDVNEPWFALTVELPNSLNGEQIQILRETFRKLELMSPIAIRKAAITGETIDLGEYPRSEAEVLVNQAESIGVPVRQCRRAQRGKA